ncbi:urea ABC transporter permease subunit UrtB [Steroidobacter flavus]|uniref:Urea ABC transporter permease subunit UrtB n=1 Tax=Steroidobacter flavus TaxID=1842136 RepID=A0ABV8T672_9GAMM
MLWQPASAAEAPTFEQALGALATASFKDKERAIGELIAVRHPNTRAALNALLEGNLYYRKSDQRVFIGTAQDSTLQLQDPVTLSPAGAADASEYSKITTNNQLRKTLKSALASFDLADPDARIRLAAVSEMLRSLDADSVSILRARESKEPDDTVRQAIRTGLAIADLDNENAAIRLTALEQLKGSLNPEVFNRLTAIVTPGDDGSYAEPDEKVRNAARVALASVERWRSWYGTLETLFFGMSLGSVLVLSAIGLAITFGVMGVINMAHGELMMLGAYTTYVVQLLMPQHIGASVLVAIPLAFIVAGGVGVLIERGIVRFLYGRPLETLLATFGVSLVLQQLVRDIFTANNRPVETPEWMAGSLQINEALSITYNRLYVVLFMLIVFAILQLVLNKTSLGLKVRAVAQNRAMAKSMGVRTEWVDALTFGLGSGIAGIAGVALSQLTNVGPNLGQSYIIDSFMVVVFGGVSNLWGTLIGGMSLGVLNQMLEPYAGAVLAKILVLIALILFIQRRPRGLFPQKGRAAEG